MSGVALAKRRPWRAAPQPRASPALGGPRVRALLAVTGGVLLFAGHPPLDLWVAGPVALVPLFALGRDAARSRRPLRVGLWWGAVAGTVFFTPLLYWIATVEVVALPLLVAVQSAFVALFVAGLAAWGSRPWRPLTGVVWWVALEAVRSAFPWGGFPWGVLGYTQAAGGPLLPVARSLGVLGVSAACAVVAACVEEAAHRAAHAPGGDVEGLRTLRAPALGLVAVGAAAMMAGGQPPSPSGRTLDVAAVQGNDLHDSSSLARSRVVEIAERMAALTEQLADSPEGLPDLVVWPENALDGDVTAGQRPDIEPIVARALAALDTTPLLTGMVRTEDGRQLNTMAALAPDGSLEEVYAKRSLVPFGEYVPLQEYLGWLPPLERASNFAAGTEPGVFSLAGAKVATVICFENNFPQLTRSQVREGAEVLVVSTNNASFGFSPASRQHIAFSRLRAVESGRWLLHAGLSGSSAVIDPSGRVHEQTGLFEQAIVRARLPLIVKDTPFTRAGDIVGPLAMATAALGLLGIGSSRVLSGWRARRGRQ